MKFLKRARTYGALWRQKSKHRKQDEQMKIKHRIINKQEKKNVKQIKTMERKTSALDAIIIEQSGLCLARKES